MSKSVEFAKPKTQLNSTNQPIQNNNSNQQTKPKPAVVGLVEFAKPKIQLNIKQPTDQKKQTQPKLIEFTKLKTQLNSTNPMQPTQLKGLGGFQRLKTGIFLLFFF